MLRCVCVCWMILNWTELVLKSPQKKCLSACVIAHTLTVPCKWSMFLDMLFTGTSKYFRDVVSRMELCLCISIYLSLSLSLSPLSLSRKSFPFVKNCGIRLIIGRKSIRLTQRSFLLHTSTENARELSRSSQDSVHRKCEDKQEQNLSFSLNYFSNQSWAHKFGLNLICLPRCPKLLLSLGPTRALG